MAKKIRKRRYYQFGGDPTKPESALPLPTEEVPVGQFVPKVYKLGDVWMAATRSGPKKGNLVTVTDPQAIAYYNKQKLITEPRIKDPRATSPSGFQGGQSYVIDTYKPPQQELIEFLPTESQGYSPQTGEPVGGARMLRPKGFGGTLGKVLKTASPFLSFIPGVGALAAPIAGMAGNVLTQTDKDLNPSGELDPFSLISSAAGFLPSMGGNELVKPKAGGGSLNFKSGAAYKKWLAYGHASGEFAKTPGHQKVSIKGKAKKVQHDLGGFISNGGEIDYISGGELAREQGLEPIYDAYLNNPATPARRKKRNLTRYDGYTHDDGGIVLGNTGNEVETGETRNEDYIFSDRMKVPGKKYSFADASKKIENKYSVRDNDKISEMAKERELNRLTENQETERRNLFNKTYQKAYGGKIRKYQGLGPIPNYLQYFQQPEQDVNLGGTENMPYSPEFRTGYQDFSMVQPTGTFSQPGPGILEQYGPPEEKEQPEFKPYQYALMGAQGLGAIHDIGRGIKGGQDVSYERVAPSYVDYDPTAGVQDIQQAYREAEKNIAGYNQGSGQYLTQRGLLGTKKAQDVSKFRTGLEERERNINAEIANRTASQNAQIAMAESQAQQLEKDTASNVLSQGLYNLGAVAGGIGRDITGEGVQRDVLPAIGSSNYKWVRDPQTGRLRLTVAALGGRLKYAY